MVIGVKIYPLEQMNPNDARGETWLWVQHQARQLMICRRKAGSTSCHYHKGEDPSKKPEQLFIAQGIVKFTFYNPTTSEREELVVTAGTSIYIDPWVVHKTEVIDDAIILESREVLFRPDKPDTNKVEI